MGAETGLAAGFSAGVAGTGEFIRPNIGSLPVNQNLTAKRNGGIPPKVPKILLFVIRLGLRLRFSAALGLGGQGAQQLFLGDLAMRRILAIVGLRA